MKHANHVILQSMPILPFYEAWQARQFFKAQQARHFMKHVQHANFLKHDKYSNVLKHTKHANFLKHASKQARHSADLWLLNDAYCFVHN